MNGGTGGVTAQDWITIVVALISAAATIITVVITTRASNREITHKLETSQAVTDTKLQNLTDEVRQHNGFAQRIPVMEEQIRQLTNRTERLEKEVAP